MSERVGQGCRSVEIETKYAEVEGVRYAYRELRAAAPVDPTPLVFMHRFRGTLDDWDRAFVDAMAEGGKTDHYARLRELRQPTLIINGDNDHFFPVENEWLLCRELPNAQLAIYSQAGHAPHQQHPEIVATQVHRFLNIQEAEPLR